MGGIKGLREDWYCKFCNKHQLKTPYYARMELYCNPTCQNADKKNKPVIALVKYHRKHPEKHREFAKMMNPQKIREATLKVYQDRPEVRQKISQTLKNKGILPPSQKGTTHPKEWKEYMSKLAKENNWIARALPFSHSEKQRLVAAQNILKTRLKLGKKDRMTDIEIIIDKYLTLNKISHKYDYPIGRKLVDFYLPRTNEILEADSEYWHKDKNEIERDTYIKDLMPKVNIIHLPEKDILNGNWLNLWKVTS